MFWGNLSSIRSEMVEVLHHNKELELKLQVTTNFLGRITKKYPEMHEEFEKIVEKWNYKDLNYYIVQHWKKEIDHLEQSIILAKDRIKEKIKSEL